MYPKGMNAGGLGAGSPEVPLPRRQRFREWGGFCIPGAEFRLAESFSLGKLKSRTRPDSA